ncbi:MAG: DUF4886 domain-containing protein [Bacilli bacterium]|nr:DUF4886 domain-containing protein [Bacilli bacterium]
MKKGIIISILALTLIGCSNKGEETSSTSSIGPFDIVSIDAKAINPDIKYLSTFDENNIEVKVTKGNGDIEYIPVSELIIDDSDFNSTDLSNKTSVTIFTEKYKYSQEIEFNIVPRDDFKVLFIGNSFSHNLITFMKPIANNLGITSEIGNLNIGGASIDDHLGFIGSTIKPYIYEYVEDNGTITINSPVNGTVGLNDKKWDFISFQQNSLFSGMGDSYDDAFNLIASAFSHIEDNDTARALWHMTWAYQSDYSDSRFESYHYDQMEMYNGIVDAVNTWIVDNPFISGIIPSGTAIQNARTSFVGDHLTVDGFHLNEGLGCYIIGLLGVKSLTNCDLSKLTYRPSSVSELQMQMAIEAVENAFVNPFEITESTYTDGPTYNNILKN